MYRFSFLLATVFLISCTASDVVKELPNGYVYASESEFFKVIEKQKKVGDSIYKISIPNCVIDFEYNDNYLVAKQKEFSATGDFANDRIRFDSIKTINYWVVDLQNDYLMGPIGKDSFLTLTRNINLPDID